MKARLLACCCLAVVSLQAQDTLKTTTIMRYYNGVKQNLIASAEQMPAGKYGFRLTPDQMSFGEWINHSTEYNYRDCSALGGEQNPMPKAQVDLLQTKEAILKGLQDSFAYCDAAFAGLDDGKVLASPQMTYSFLHTVVHNNEIYGNIVGYLRVSEIVPPSTARRGAGRNTKK